MLRRTIAVCKRRYGEKELKWTGDTAWTFSNQFAASYEFLESQHVVLLVDGLDTVADILINGKKVHSTNNAFR